MCVREREREREREAHEEIVSPYVCFEFRPKKCTYDVMTDENETRENMMRVATEPCKAVCDTFALAGCQGRGCASSVCRLSRTDPTGLPDSPPAPRWEPECNIPFCPHIAVGQGARPNARPPGPFASTSHE